MGQVHPNIPPERSPREAALPSDGFCSPRSRATFGISFETEQGATVISIAGDVDMATAPQLERSLMAAESDMGGVVLDLTKVTFLDSSGLHVLLRSSQRLKLSGRTLHVVSPEGPVRRLFEITVVTAAFELSPSRTAAVAAAVRS